MLKRVKKERHIQKIRTKHVKDVILLFVMVVNKKGNKINISNDSVKFSSNSEIFAFNEIKAFLCIL